MNIPKVINCVVKNDLCIGCGLCVYKCPSKALKIEWNNFGFLVPQQNDTCDENGDCLTVCPFNPIPEPEVRTENEIAQLFLQTASKQHPKVGKYTNIYAGYAPKYRANSSSGGIATYIFNQLLKTGIVDHVISVRNTQDSENHYEYGISSSEEELLRAAKTKYYPVTLAGVLPKIHELPGKVAIVGVACFIKAIRLAQHKEPALKEKIPFLVGIICGGVKSRFFTEYLASKAGVAKQNILEPQFRIKDIKSTAGDYSFGCTDKSDNQNKMIKMRSVGDMWGTGLFKANACDFCDDVATELADISLGDAWIPPYGKDGQGTNIIISRSLLAEKLMRDGIKNKHLTIEALEIDRFVSSQQGSFNHRHLGLSARIKQAQLRNQPIPPKRFGNYNLLYDFKIVQKTRMNVRKNSLEFWKKSPNAKVFDIAISPSLTRLKKVTRIYHYRRGIIRRLKKIIGNTTK